MPNHQLKKISTKIKSLETARMILHLAERLGIPILKNNTIFESIAKSKEFKTHICFYNNRLQKGINGRVVSTEEFIIRMFGMWAPPKPTQEELEIQNKNLEEKLRKIEGWYHMQNCNPLDNNLNTLKDILEE